MTSRSAMHPGAWILWATCAGLVTFTTTNPFYLALVVAVSFFVYAAQRIPGPTARSFRVFAIAGLITMVVRTALVFLGTVDAGNVAFAALEGALAPDAVLASSTSGLMPSELQAGRAGPERYVVGHPFNPPHLIPLVEVVGGRETDPAVVDWAARLYAALGKRPIRLRREVPGHVANRMQVALYREAIHLVLEDVASIADVDAAIAYGPGLRWALMGPHMAHHLAGGRGGLRHLLEHIGPGIERWWNDLGRPDLTPAVIDRLVENFGQAETRPELVTLLAREGIEDEIARGRGVAVPVDGVEVAGARKAVAAFQPGSGRETLAALCAAALEDRAPGARRHARAKPVPALPASNVRLEGAFHER